MARTALRISEPMPAPHWALLERQLLDAITNAYLEVCGAPYRRPALVNNLPG